MGVTTRTGSRVADAPLINRALIDVLMGIVTVLALGGVGLPKPGDVIDEGDRDVMVDGCLPTPRTNVGEGDREDAAFIVDEAAFTVDEAVGLMNPCAAVGALLIKYGGLPRSPSFTNCLLRSLLWLCESVSRRSLIVDLLLDR